MIISGLGKVSEEAGLPPTEAAGSPKPGLKPTSHFGLRKVAGGGGSGMGSIGKALQGSAAKEQVLAADEKESTFATAGGRPLVATSNLHDEDVFGLQLVPQGAFDDVVYVNSCAMILQHPRAPTPNPTPAPNYSPNPNPNPNPDSNPTNPSPNPNPSPSPSPSPSPNPNLYQERRVTLFSSWSTESSPSISKSGRPPPAQS